MENSIQKFLIYMEQNLGRSAVTVRTYQGYLVRFMEYLQKVGINYTDLELMDLEAYAGPVLHKAGIGLSGRSAVISSIKQFYRYCQRRKIVEKDPARFLEHPQKGESLPGILSLADVEKLLYAPDLSSFQGLRDAAIMGFLFGTGCRVSGLTSLNDNQLTYGGEEKPPRWYVVLKEKGKKERKLPINRKVELLLFAYLNHAEMKEIDRTTGTTKVVFVNLKNTHIEKHQHKGEGRRLTTKSIAQILKKYGRRCGIDEKLLHPHASRHTFGTHLYDEGIMQEDRQAAMGHVRADTLMVYTRLSERRLLEIADKANPMDKIKTPVDELVKAMFGKEIKVKGFRGQDTEKKQKI